MAKAAEDMLARTETQIALTRRQANWTIVEIGMLLLTVLAAGLAAFSASKAARALPDIERAFVSPSYSPLQQRLDGSYHFPVSWHNSGKTPALHVRNRVVCETRSDPLPEDFDFPDGGEEPVVTYIAPQAGIGAFLPPIPAENIDAAKQGKAHIYVWATVEYDDVFGVPHRTEFCVQSMVTDQYKLPGGKLAARIQFIGYPRFNAVDDDCYRKPTKYKPSRPPSH